MNPMNSCTSDLSALTHPTRPDCTTVRAGPDIQGTTMNLSTTEFARPAAGIAFTATTVAVLADSAVEGDGAARLDPQVASEVLTLRSDALTTFAHLLTFLGSEVVVSVAWLILALVLLERRGPRIAGLSAIAMAISASLTVGAKLAIGRPRPTAIDRLGPLDSSYSFPSGHALNSAVLLGLACLLLVPLLRDRGVRLVAYGAATLLAVGIGASRVYLGYHWTTDVLASWAIAATLLMVAHAAQGMLTARSTRSGSGQVGSTRVET